MANALLLGENIEDVAESIKEAFDNGGIEEVKKQVAELQDGWKTVSVKVGVIGRAGVGKSTFINAYRNILYDDEEGAAPVGVTQTTMVATPYHDPENENIVLYDVPGVGTDEFPKSSYLDNQRVGIDKYDFIILITSTRFTEAEIWLYEAMKQRSKPVFLVKTKVIEDVDNERKRKREQAKKTKPQVITEVIEKYQSEMNLGAKVYYIDSHERDNPDLQFGELLSDIVTEIPKNKREALLFNLRIYTPKLIEKKVELLQKRKWFLGFISGAVAAIPIPGISVSIDIALVTGEGIFYRKQLGLETEKELSVRVLKEKARQAVTLLTEKWKFISLRMIGALVTSEGIESASKIAIPVIGSVISAAVSYGATVYTLKKLLDAMAKDAIEVNGIFLENLRNDPDDC